MASSFIHLTPCSATWTMRWWAPVIMRKWPGVFDLPDPNEPMTETFWDIFLPGFTFYMIWFSIYTVWMISYGRFMGTQQHFYDTTYHYFMRTSASKSIGYNSSHPSALSPVILFLIGHLIVCNIAIGISYIFWFNFYLHTALCLGLFCACTY